MEQGKRTFWDQKVFQSAIRSPYVTGKERILGYLVGPIGAQLLYFLMQTWLNVYYTDVLGLTQLNPDFLFWFPLASGFVVAALNLLFGYLIDRTKTKQGKARPYILLSALTLPISGCLLFAIPTDNATAEYVLIVLSFNFFFALSYAIYNSAYNLLVPLSSRNSKTRNVLSTLSNLGMMLGQAIGSLFPTLIYPYIGTDKNLWLAAMAGISVLALPFLLLEYYFTRERVTEEETSSAAKADEEKKPTLKLQLKAVLSDKYWWIVILYTFIFQLGLCFKNSSAAYYCNWVIGSYQDGYTMLLFNLIGGASLAIGAIIINPLAKKFSKQTLMITGFIFYALGDLLCFLISYPGLTGLDKNTIFILVLIGQFIKNAGAIPCVYIWMSLVADVLDHLEWKAGLRCDGVTVSFMTIFALFMPILGNAIINKLLAQYGYDAPVEGHTVTGQNTTLQIIFDGCCVGAEVISSLIIVLLMSFLNVEKNLAKEQTEIEERRKAEVLARGETYQTPEAKAQAEEAEYEKETEMADLLTLQKKCNKKHLNFEIEKAKYEEKKAKKQEKERGKAK
jgi:GPH family glycoside/pentoside/hexuronide:cation symporter